MTAHQDKKIKPRLIYTPHKHIPIGEVVEDGNGRKLLRIKKAGGKATEDISIEYMVSAVVNTKKA